MKTELANYLNTETEKVKFEQKLEILLNEIKKSARNQFEYNLKSNVPAGALKIEDCAENGLIKGAVHAVSAFNKWETSKAIRFAYDILEDSNCHTEAKSLAPFIQE